MITVRRSRDRGHLNHGWLDTYHTFSFGTYQDAAHMGFRALRVINEDRVEPGQGFPTHPHADMEIITYIISGSLEHRDDMGNGATIRAGEVQRMRAGTGVRHSESNPSTEEAVHLLQIWVLPDEEGLTPSYEQKDFTEGLVTSTLCLIASPDGRDGSLTVRQDLSLYSSRMVEGRKLEYAIAPGRHIWLQLITGEMRVGDHEIFAGDACAVSEEESLYIEGVSECEFLLFDLA